MGPWAEIWESVEADILSRGLARPRVRLGGLRSIRRLIERAYSDVSGPAEILVIRKPNVIGELEAAKGKTLNGAEKSVLNDVLRHIAQGTRPAAQYDSSSSPSPTSELDDEGERGSSIAESFGLTKLGYDQLEESLPESPGLYAVFLIRRIVDAEALLTAHPVEEPLYVGKAQDSLKGRDFHTHFADGKTGSSTVRRSLGAILRRELDLGPIRRGNTGKSQDFSNYRFDTASEAKLSYWMRSNLAVGWWRFNGPARGLRESETSVIMSLNPPLNLTHSKNSLVPKIKRLRKKCADLTRPESRSA